MSRALARLREVTGDPLLVRAGRGMAPSPRALELRERIGALVQEAQAALRPAGELRLAALKREFRLRTRDGFVESFGAALVARVAAEAPGVRLHFLPKPDKDSAPLRDGSVDLETGIVGASAGPELRVQALFRDRFIGVVRAGHAFTQGTVSLPDYAAARHVGIARRRSGGSPLDQALEAQGANRNIAVTVPDFSAALALVRGSDLVATLPERHTAALRAGLQSFKLPFELVPLTISLLWHPRLDADPAHRWLRGCVREICQG